MAARRKKAPELCGEHFPVGLADQPEGATVVSCEHGSWEVADLAPPADPTPPPDPDPPADPTGGKGPEGGTGGGE